MNLQFVPLWHTMDIKNVNVNMLYTKISVTYGMQALRKMWLKAKDKSICTVEWTRTPVVI